MNSLAELLVEPRATIEAPDAAGTHELTAAAAASEPGLHHYDQVQGLVQQLFFQNERPIRHVGFTAVEAGTDISQLCLDVASTLAAAGTHDVGLVDAGLQSVPLHSRLEMEPDERAEASRPISTRLWLVPRSSWLNGESVTGVWDSSLTRLRKAIMEFDYSITSFDSLSWATTRISQVCDGMVLVVTANKTRRAIAGELRERLRRARVPVLGAVLAERRLPVPESLYRSL